MLRILKEEPLICIFMIFFFVFSVAMKIMLGALYLGMIKETDNMSSTNNKLLKQCKLKFANCYQLNNGVSNIPVFVDKFLNRLKMGPLTFEGIDHLSGQAMLFSVVCAGIGICRSILKGKMLGEILPFYILSFIGLYIYFSVSTVVDVKGKKRSLKVNLVDYLENHLSVRLEVTADDMAMLYGEEKAPLEGRRRRGAPEGGRSRQEAFFAGDKRAPRERQDFKEAPKDRGMDALPEDKPGPVDGEELEQLLREFLAT